jgi:uncharacterized cupredoxin-like copper-binding protein
VTTNTTGAATGTPIPHPRGPAPPSLPTGTIVTVTESDYSLDPAHVRVKRSGLIDLRVRNAGKRPHGLLLETSVGRLQTGTIRPGRSAEIRVRLRTGLYRWYSPVNGDRRRGMKGELVVGRAKRG